MTAGSVFSTGWTRMTEKSQKVSYFNRMIPLQPATDPTSSVKCQNADHKASLTRYIKTDSRVVTETR